MTKQSHMLRISTVSNVWGAGKATPQKRIIEAKVLKAISSGGRSLPESEQRQAVRYFSRKMPYRLQSLRLLCYARNDISLPN